MHALCSKRERVEVFVSDLALLLVTSGLYKLGATFGWTWLLCTYGIPYLVVNHFLVRTSMSCAALLPLPTWSVTVGQAATLTDLHIMRPDCPLIHSRFCYAHCGAPAVALCTSHTKCAFPAQPLPSPLHMSLCASCVLRTNITWTATHVGVQVMITLLQHTHLSLPHYDDKEWDWLRGALCTVDRSYGPFLNVMHHHIADTHVAHHLFSQVHPPVISCEASWILTKHVATHCTC